MPKQVSIRDQIRMAGSPEKAQAIYDSALVTHKLASAGTKTKWKKALKGVS